MSHAKRPQTVAVLCAVSLIASLQPSRADEQLGEVDFAPTAVLNLRAAERPLDALDGRLVLLEFFAPWSDQCAGAVPHLNKLHDAHAGRGLAILSVSAAQLEDVQPFVDEHAVKYPVALMDTTTDERLSKEFSVPGMPHAVLISPTREILWTGHPRALKSRHVKPHLVGIKKPPQILPEAMVEQQKLLDDVRWGTLRTSLVEAQEGLDKISKQWAAGLIEWIDDRRGTWLTDAEALAGEARYWDAWNMFQDFPRRFEGLDGAEQATTRAGEIRADPKARVDLEAGDLVQKARGLMAEGKTRPATLVLKRVIRTFKKSPHAARAKELLAKLE